MTVAQHQLLVATKSDWLCQHSNILAVYLSKAIRCIYIYYYVHQAYETSLTSVYTDFPGAAMMSFSTPMGGVEIIHCPSQGRAVHGTMVHNIMYML